MKRLFNVLGNNLYIVYIIGFLFSLESAIPAYISSTFLASISSEQAAGLVFSFTSLVAIIAFCVIPRFLRRFGNYKIAITLSVGIFLTLIGLIASKNSATLITFFVINQVCLTLLAFSIDIFLEKYSADKATGQIRGIYLTSINFAWLLSPLASTFLLGNNEYWKIFLVAAVPILPMIFLIYYKFNKFPDPEYSSPSLLLATKQIWKNNNLKNIYIVNFMLRFFYSLMTVYTPIYLYFYLHLNWNQIGIIFLVMLIPFVILDYPLGRLADKKIGEKELLIAGVIITAIATASISLFDSPSPLILAIILFLTRIGAATIEVMTETYFFKKVGDSNANLISAYRNISPIAYVIAPLLATVFLLFFDLKMLFLALGIIMLYGLIPTLKLKDTK